ncbi:MAG TPA: PSD1 and planctomycete cytochrome C domain-containing protein [Pirellulaceae bacterium]|nr:PSD1 and planctomycete cytochrome C domain-containing protein [Pirellulaceae bacterium]
MKLVSLCSAERIRIACALAAAAACLSAQAPAAEPAPPVISAEQERFFEEKVRPVLAAKCLECHGEKKQESGLRLDSRQGVLGGGDSGEPAVVPHEPDRSLLVKAINHVGDYHMPPTTKLPDEQIAALTEWVKIGVPWPGGDSVPAARLSAADRAEHDQQTHWAYQPVQRPAIGPVRDASWPVSGLDALILSKLDIAGLTPSPAADRRTLIRRLTYDLSGLPPTPDEVDAFIADAAPDAYERLADRLLASPHFGERWGRHWLDVARYADTKGYAFAKERRYPYSYTYRDYVIRAFNRDLPYDQFILQQLAAERLPGASEDVASLAALGFLTVGRKFNNRPDDIDDQIDAVTRGFLGMTVGCARCHDHKYDAIPTEDYYSLYGVFASCNEPEELPLIGEAAEGEEYRQFEEELAKLRGELDKFAAAKHAEFLDQSRRQAADYLARVAAGSTNTLLNRLPFLSLDPKELRSRMIRRWQQFIDQRAKPDHAALGLWNDLLKVPTDGFAKKVTPVLEKWQALPAGTAAGQCNPLVQGAFKADVPATRMDVPRIYGKLLTDAYTAWQAAGANADALGKLPADQRQLAELLLGPGAPTDISKDDVSDYLSRADRNQHSELKKKVESFQATSPAAPPRAMVLKDFPQPGDSRVLIRGKPDRPGNVVPRQFLLVLSETGRQPFRDGSGRLELARAIVDPQNPLTRRVIVNRLWMHHFGEPLVNSPSDFGLRCEQPVQPEVLDYLASLLLERGWSLKDMHREMVLSSTYRQTSNAEFGMRNAESQTQLTANPHSALRNPQSVDPENRLLWRMNRRRLELESVRDTLLSLAGRLDESLYGRPVELTSAPFTRRRAVYGFIDRQDLPNMFRVFDIASPDQSSPRRPRTTVPQQALFLMNSPFAVEQAQALAARLPADLSDDAQRMSALYRLVLQREPTAAEAAIGREFLAAPNPPGSRLTPLEQYAQLLLLTSEVMYID